MAADAGDLPTAHAMWRRAAELLDLTDQADTIRAKLDGVTLP